MASVSSFAKRAVLPRTERNSTEKAREGKRRLGKERAKGGERERRKTGIERDERRDEEGTGGESESESESKSLMT